jgi:hypothetical protein
MVKQTPRNGWAVNHKEYKKEYIQSYLRKHGARKVEANALVTHPAEARALCLRAIKRYVRAAGVKRWRAWLDERQAEVREELPGVLRAAADSIALKK